MTESNEPVQNVLSRRAILAGLGAAGISTAAGALLSGCGSANHTIALATPTPSPSATPVTPITDADILNFALNFEYLGANYYQHALNGQSLSSSDTGAGAGGVIGGRQVSFSTPYIQQIATQFLADELGHVRTIRSSLGGAAVPQPTIDLTNSFNVLAAAAGIGSSFDPFANEDNFLLGAFIFEEVDVSAFIGAAPLLTSAANLAASASILGTEAYHGGALRTLIYNLGNSTYDSYATAIAALRQKVGGGSEQPLTGTTIVPTNSSSIIAGRTPSQVLRIAYAAASATAPATKGGFFPNGLNGRITAA